MRAKATLAELERLRMIAADRLDEGRTPAEIAAFLGVRPQTVREWRRDYLAGGRAALAPAKPAGRPRKLTDAQRAALPGLLAAGSAAHGYADAHLWTTRLVARLIGKRFGVRHHHGHVGVTSAATATIRSTSGIARSGRSGSGGGRLRRAPARLARPDPRGLGGRAAR